MSCCGAQRGTFTAVPVSATPPRPTPAATKVQVRYLGDRAITTRGSVSGRTYTFAPDRAVQAVDERDVSAFVRTRLFRMG